MITTSTLSLSGALASFVSVFSGALDALKEQVWPLVLTVAVIIGVIGVLVGGIYAIFAMVRRRGGN